MANYLAYRDGGKTNEQGLFQWLGKLFGAGTPSIGTPTSLQVIQRGAGANMSIDVSVGDVSIVGTAGYNYYGFTDAVNNIVVSAADPTNPRITITVAYVDLAVVSSASNNNPNALKFINVNGTAAGSPVDPSGATIQAACGAGNPYITIGRITLPAAASTVVTAYITDIRTPIAFKGKLYGGASNTVGHTIPNAADDTVLIANGTQVINGSHIIGSGSTPIEGAWASWTPTLTNLTLGNGTLTAKYIQIGKIVHLRFVFTLGSTSAVGTNPSFSLPVTAVSYGNTSTGQPVVGIVRYEDNAVAGYGGFVNISTTSAGLGVYSANGTYLGLGGVTAALPFAFSTSDEIIATVTYEAA